MAILMLISKCIGFVREMVFAGFFGTSYVTDSYVMATAIPTILFGGVLGAVATAYMPIYSEIAEEKGEADANHFTSQIINILLIISIISSILGIIFSDQIVRLLASGFHGDTAELTSFYVKITLSYVIFSSITTILEANLQYKGVFLPQVITGYLLSGATIIVIIFSAYTNHYYLAFGLLLGHMARFFIILIISKHKGFKYSKSMELGNTAKRIIALSLPVFIGSSFSQINTFVDKTLASGLKEGSVAALNYGMLLVNMIFALTIGILTTIIYPRLSQSSAQGDYKRFGEIVSTGVELITIASIPCSLGAILYSRQIIQIVYERGAFDQTATSMTSSAFLYYSIGLLFMALADIFIRAYYALHDMKTPILCASISVIINVILNLIFVRYMAHNGLALATSIAAACSTTALYIGLRIKYKKITIIRSKTKIIKIITAAFISVGCSWLAYQWIIIPLINIRLIQLCLAVLTAALVYYRILRLMKVEEVKLIWQILKR